MPEMPRVTDLLGASALIEPDHVPGAGDPEPGDLTREPTIFPMTRAERLQALARSDEGFLLGLAYSTQRGYGGTHPFAGEIRVGEVEVEFEAPELGLVRRLNAEFQVRMEAKQEPVLDDLADLTEARA